MAGQSELLCLETMYQAETYGNLTRPFIFHRKQKTNMLDASMRNCSCKEPSKS